MIMSHSLTQPIARLRGAFCKALSLFPILALTAILCLPSCADVKGLFTKDRDGVGVCIGYDDETALPDTGMGTEAEPYVLCLPVHLSLIGSGDYELSAYYIQGRTLNLNNELFTPIAGAFTGSFDGQNRKIQNLKISVDTPRAGLFAELGAGGLIQNLALEEVDVASINTGGSARVGGLVALMSAGTIKNCSLTDSDGEPDLKAASGATDNVGGLVGRQEGGKIIASYATGSANGGDGPTDSVGGLLGWQNSGDIIASYATGDADGGVGSDKRVVGGLVGEQYSGSIIASYATGAANGGAGDQDRVGGLVGRQDGGSIIASYATGSADGGEGGTDYVGGLVGHKSGGSIIASYATGSADGGEGGTDSVGGLVGEQDSGDIIASYATGDANGGEGITDRAGGLVGEQYSGSIIASYATGVANGGAGEQDRAGGLVGERFSGSDTASYGFGAPDGEVSNMIGDPRGLDVNAFTASEAGTQWGGSPSPWIFSSGRPPRLGYITGRTGVTYTCDPALLPEGVACGDELPGQ